jgi:hypothetical protein
VFNSDFLVYAVPTVHGPVQVCYYEHTDRWSVADEPAWLRISATPPYAFDMPDARRLAEAFAAISPGPRVRRCRAACLALARAVPLDRDATGCVMRALWAWRLEKAWLEKK